MPLFSGILGSVLGGAGGGLAQMSQDALKREQLAQVAALEREKLAQQESEFSRRMQAAEAERFVPRGLVAGGLPSSVGEDVTQIPVGALPFLLGQAKQEQEQRLQGRIGALIGQSGGAPAQPLPPEAAMYSPQAETAARPAMAPSDLVRALAALGPEGIKAAEVFRKGEGDWVAMGDSGLILHKGTGEIRTAPQFAGLGGEAGPAAEGMQRTITRGPFGQVKSMTDRPIEARDDFDRMAQQITNPQTGQRYNRYEDLPPELQRTVTSNVEGFRGRIAAQTGAGSFTGRQQAEMAAEVGPAASKYIHPQTGQSPDPTMPLSQVLRQGYMQIQHPADRTALGDLQSTKATVSQLTQMADQLITATSPTDAAIQGARLNAAALVKSDPLATTYQDTKQAFLGTLSRALGGERGVLTNQDIARINNALPSFFDTVAVKDAKSAILQNLLSTATEAKMAAMTGAPMSTAYQGRITDLISGMERANAGGARPLQTPGVSGFGTGLKPATPPPPPNYPPRPGKIVIQAPDGTPGYWNARQAIPEGYRRMD
jgi:hypothetical protein